MMTPLCLALLPSLLLTARLPVLEGPAQEVVQRRLSAMGTWLDLSIEAPSRPQALAASEAALRAVENVERRLSTWNEESELAALNRAPVGTPHALSPELEATLREAQHCFERTQGTFDPGIGSLVRAWDLRGQGRRPSPTEIESASIGASLAQLELGAGTAMRRHAGLLIEEGGFGKGVGLNAALEALRSHGIRRARVDLGGQIAVLGDGLGRVPVADPNQRDSAVLAVTLHPDTSIATSGNSQRALEVEGQRIGHLLDPRTGCPVPDFGSLSVIAQDAATADALATGLYVMGPTRALDWVATQPGIECVVLEARAGALIARASAGLAGRIELLDDRVQLEQVSARPAAFAGPAQESDTETRLRNLEQANDRLENHVEVLTGEIERLQLGGVESTGDEASRTASGARGLGNAASKVYRQGQGVSIGGYGEFLYQDREGSAPVSDAQRVVTYIGYKFNDQFIFNSEIEVEHGSTGKDGEVALEFGYIDWLVREDMGVRAGLLLAPLGWLNEMHEPTSFLAAERSQTEGRIIPSTWRENGIGLHGQTGGFDWRAYALTGLEGEGFGASGLRGGRQKGSKSVADDLAAALRLDWTEQPGVIVGASAYHGDSGQGEASLPDLSTTIVDLHAQFESGPWTLRGLAVQADVDDAGAFNAQTGEGLAETLEGWYVELGYDLFTEAMPVEGQSLTPFVRFESIDTQTSMPSGFARDPTQADDILTLGLNWKPIDNVVVKVDYQDWNDGADRFDFLIGYIF